MDRKFKRSQGEKIGFPQIAQYIISHRDELPYAFGGPSQPSQERPEFEDSQQYL
jgi:hypothetical protein